MFKILWPSKNQKYIHILSGYCCGDSTHCKHSNNCKYKGNFKFHNFSVKIRRFFRYKFKINLPIILTISQKWERLSGTPLCPKSMPRQYDCFDCKHLSFRHDLEGECTSNDYLTDREISKNRQCKYFEKSEYADDFLNMYK